MKSEITGDTYFGASQIKLSETEMTKLSAPFEDLDFEIRPDGFIYLPQAMYTKRLNDVLGIGNWALLLVKNAKEDLGNGKFKVFYDGVLMIRGQFASRSCGEATYMTSNDNQSWASALEAAKSDCRVRCCKDLGIAADAWMPAFIRAWQKKYAIRVFVRDERRNKIVPQWRRSDVDPFWNETGEVQTTPTVATGAPATGQKSSDTTPNGLPWLNHGPDYDQALGRLLQGNTTIPALRESYRISRETAAALTEVINKDLKSRVEKCDNMVKLSALYNEMVKVVESTDGAKEIFTKRREALKQPA